MFISLYLVKSIDLLSKISINQGRKRVLAILDIEITYTITGKVFLEHMFNKEVIKIYPDLSKLVPFVDFRRNLSTIL